MKTNKKLKLDTLSSNELTGKEANQTQGGRPFCYCVCMCDETISWYSDRFSVENSAYNMRIENEQHR